MATLAIGALISDMRMIRLLTLVAFVALPAWAGSGVVIGVHDGDTLTVIAQQRPVKIRLAEIDAPELSQPFGTRSRQALAALCFQKDVSVQEVGKDRYGRVLGRVQCAGVDANREQVRQGMAWVFDRYVKDKSLYADQESAKAERRGLWADPVQEAPWTWRKAKREKASKMLTPG